MECALVLVEYDVEVWGPVVVQVEGHGRLRRPVQHFLRTENAGASEGDDRISFHFSNDRSAMKRAHHRGAVRRLLEHQQRKSVCTHGQASERAMSNKQGSG